MTETTGSSSPLLLSRRFAPLFWCQFFSAFSDNVLRNALVFVILFRIGEESAGTLIALAAAVFIAPFFFLSGVGGQMADRYDKAMVAQRIKFVEIGIALIAIVGFWIQSVPILFVALFLFGVAGSLFGPIKYGILPDLLRRHELPPANALVEGATFMAILLGTIVGGLAAQGGGNPVVFGVLMLIFAAIGWGSALYIPPVGRAAPDLVVDSNIARSTMELIRHLRSDRRLMWGALVISWFWMVGAVVLSLLPPFVTYRLGGTESVVTAFLAIFSISVAIGSGLAAWLAAGRIILLPTLIGAILLGAFAIDLGIVAANVTAASTPQGLGALLSTSTGVRVAIDLAGMAIAGGLYIVPTFAAVQAWADADQRARVIAGVNVLNAAFMVGGSAIFAGLQAMGFSMPTLFMALGGACLIVAILIGRSMPGSALMDLLSILARAIFRAEVKGVENLQRAGHNPIIALNHVSFLDAPLALSLIGRNAVFAIDSAIAQTWWARLFMPFTRALPLDPTRPMATRTLINVVKDGNPLVIFPEGRITVTGSLMKVYDGAGMIADKTGAFVVPVRIEGLEQTPFSRLDRQQVRRRWFPKVTVTILEPVKLDIDPDLRGRVRRMAAGAALYEVMSNLLFQTTSIDRTVVEALIEAAHRHGPRTIALEDPVAGKLSYRKLLLGTAILGRKLMDFAPEGRPVGVMLPNTNGAAVTIFALMSAGRVPAMINFSAGATNVRAACKAADLKVILTARSFIEKGRLQGLVDAIQDDVRIVYLEDLRATITIKDKLRGLMEARRPLVARKPDDWAAVLFTSGSEGTPKGVVLSHRNMLANAAQAVARIDFGKRDKVFNVLPVFHSFGLTVGLVLPVVSGVQVYMYPSPLHYRIVPELIYGVNATILFGTDTFLSGYARGAHPYDLRSLRYILAGAEPVKESTRRIYLEKFGIRILEGYGITETAPALALNTPMFNKFGTVGRLFPGMEARLEKVEGVEEGGRLFVKGPNVMLGYLRVENPGVLEPPPEGWHDTGDIVAIDKQGFITIKGRAKRFAKVGGEMVSLAAVESLAADLWPDAMTAVVAVPDARRGERLVMITQKQGAQRAEFQAHARSKGASELMMPSEIVTVDKLPVLGSGKVDLVTIEREAKERAGRNAAKPTELV